MRVVRCREHMFVRTDVPRRWTVPDSLSSTSFSDANVVNGTTYYYVVSGLNGAGESPDSNQAAADR